MFILILMLQTALATDFLPSIRHAPGSCLTTAKRVRMLEKHKPVCDMEFMVRSTGGLPANLKFHSGCEDPAVRKFAKQWMMRHQFEPGSRDGAHFPYRLRWVVTFKPIDRSNTKLYQPRGDAWEIQGADGSWSTDRTQGHSRPCNMHIETAFIQIEDQGSTKP
jgi:hypothetical protein